MSLTEMTAKSILRKHKRIDSWFVSSYAMNLYRGCAHNCVYCDGRDEKYQVAGEFGRDIEVKTNAIDLLDRELDPSRKRKPMRGGYFLMGGGVGDSYQPVEKKYGLMEKTLKLMIKYGHPVHLLTKSTLVERDIELIQEINRQNKAIASFSFSSVDKEIGRFFEPGVPEPEKRLVTIEKMKSRGIDCGMFLMPVLPYLTDTDEQLEKSVKAAKDAGVDFIIFGGLTLKPGQQMGYFYNRMDQYRPDLTKLYRGIYKGDRWGNADGRYYQSITGRFNEICKAYKMPRRIPFNMFENRLDLNDKAVVMLEHLDYILKSEGQKSPYGTAAYSISQLKEPISDVSDLRGLRGVGGYTAKLLREIITTGDCAYYQKVCG